MRRTLLLLAAILASVFIAGCGSSGHSADAPAGGVTLVPGDGIITVSWVMQPGVDYWLFLAPAASISTSNWSTTPNALSFINAVSPFVASGLANGTVYSFTMNGRTNGGPGGEGTPSVSAVPRLAGTATASLPAPWSAGTALGASALRGVVWSGTQFVAVGAAGVMYSSPDGVTWTAITSPVTSNLNAETFTSPVYSVVGDGGVILYSIDAITWTVPASSGAVTANNLYAVAGGVGRIVAVGAAGTIIISADGLNWTAAASSGKATTNDLYAVKSYGNLWIAVGAKDPVTKQGTLLTSLDNGNTWAAITSNAPSDLKGVTWGKNAATGAIVFAAVGASGTLVTSTDATTWTAQPALGTNTLSAVTYATQFVAVGASGSIFTSTDGTTWAGPQPIPASAASSNLNAIANGAYNYSVVGTAGANLLAK